ncbi:hypothetical protein ZHAS_00012409 [Anopheles sinensis]|uniref:Uncharacterized protein n=1 Tax=Anopheles sinensis TaxID=74873 RepID=A0A084W2T5_ANOSI|nr:hypothetical protein ZHAS_00012409 [Anopheles sinensis]
MQFAGNFVPTLACSACAPARQSAMSADVWNLSIAAAPHTFRRLEKCERHSRAEIPQTFRRMIRTPARHRCGEVCTSGAVENSFRLKTVLRAT